MLRKLKKLGVFSILLALIITVSIGLVSTPAVYAEDVESLCGDTADGHEDEGGGCGGGDEGSDHEGGCGSGDEGTEHSGGCSGSGGSGGQGGSGDEDAVPPNKGPLKLSNFTLAGERIVTWELSQLVDPAETTVLQIVQGSEATASYTVKAQKECRKRFRGKVTIEAKPGPGVSVERIRIKLFKGETVISTLYLSESATHFEKGVTDYKIDFVLGPNEANQLPENISATMFFEGLDKGPQPRKKYISTSVAVPANRGDTTLTGELLFPGNGLEPVWLKIEGCDVSIDTSAIVDGYVYAATVNEEIYRNAVFEVETGFRGNLAGNYSITHVARLGEDDSDSAVVNVHVFGADCLPPKAEDDNFNIRGLSTRVIDVLANDTDYFGEGLTVIQAAYEEDTIGVAEISEDGKSLVYTPGGYGTDTFTYTAIDEKGGTDSAQVTVNVLRKSSGSSGSGNDDVNNDSDGSDENSDEEPNEGIAGDQDEQNETEGSMILPDTAGPAPGDDASLEDPLIGNIKVNVSPKRVPAGDPTITVSIDGVVQVYAMLPDGRKLELKEVKPGYWKKSFMVPFGTPDGSYLIRVIAVNSAGMEKKANYTITIDNSLPLMQVSRKEQDNRTYLLNVKPMFNATKIYYEYSGGLPIELIKEGEFWTAEVPDVSGQVVGVDESGYIVRLDVSLAKIAGNAVEMAHSILNSTGTDLALTSAAVSDEVTGNTRRTDNAIPIVVIFGAVIVILGVLLRKRYGCN
ncbi:Ig-like domain-containing protein [Phosphitispora sp. TUW77]|uniref:Ig-like domain-containing protein n=1 Tax=Phosphitispora sp. TUW77 TaxID=3152361 RepID=UPI003AB4374B